MRDQKRCQERWTPGNIFCETPLVGITLQLSMEGEFIDQTLDIADGTQKNYDVKFSSTPLLAFEFEKNIKLKIPDYEHRCSKSSYFVRSVIRTINEKNKIFERQQRGKGE